MQLTLAAKRTDLGFIEGGFEQWRKYYDNFGGYDSAVSPPGGPTGGSLELEESHYWVNFGLTLPNWPEIVLGFEEQSRVGNESTLQWGNVNGKNIGPANAAIDEHTDILKLDVSGDLFGWQWDEQARVEILRHRNLTDESSAPGVPFQTKDRYNDVQGINTLKAEKAVCDWWLVSAGYCYSRIEANDALNQSGPPPLFQYGKVPK